MTRINPVNGLCMFLLVNCTYQLECRSVIWFLSGIRYQFEDTLIGIASAKCFLIHAGINHSGLICQHFGDPSNSAIQVLCNTWLQNYLPAALQFFEGITPAFAWLYGGKIFSWFGISLTLDFPSECFIFSLRLPAKGPELKNQLAWGCLSTTEWEIANQFHWNFSWTKLPVKIILHQSFGHRFISQLLANGFGSFLGQSPQFNRYRNNLLKSSIEGLCETEGTRSLCCSSKL